MASKQEIMFVRTCSRFSHPLPSSFDGRMEIEGPQSKVISLLRQKQLGRRDRGADRRRLSPRPLRAWRNSSRLFPLHPNGWPLALHCNNSLPVLDKPDIALRGSLAGRNTDRLQIVLHGVLADLAAHGCADLARGAVMYAVVDTRVDDLCNVF
jgi:hypothetical protein